MKKIAYIPVCTLSCAVFLTSMLCGCTSDFHSESVDKSSGETTHSDAGIDSDNSIVDRDISNTSNNVQFSDSEHSDSEPVSKTFSEEELYDLENYFGYNIKEHKGYGAEFQHGSVIKVAGVEAYRGYVDDRTEYIWLRFTDEDIGDIYCYSFLYDPCDSGIEPDLGNDEPKWYVVGLTICVSKRLKASDFDCINVGSSLEDVAAVDPIAGSFYMCRTYDADGLVDGAYFYTDDGLIHISLEHESLGESYIVTGIELISDFAVPPDSIVNEKRIEDGKKPFPDIVHKINPKDLPPE